MFKDNNPNNLSPEMGAWVQRFTMGRTGQKIVPPLVEIFSRISVESISEVMKKANELNRLSFSVSKLSAAVQGILLTNPTPSWAAIKWT